MQVAFLALFWATVTAGLLLARCLLFILGLIPSCRRTSEALDVAAVRAWIGAFVLQLLSFFAFIPMLLLAWSVQAGAESAGASPKLVQLLSLPVGLLALAIPPCATLVGAVQGFRLGWYEAMGRESQLGPLPGKAGIFMRRLGLDWAFRW